MKIALISALAVSVVLFGCDKKSNPNLAPSATALSSAMKPSEGAIPLAIEGTGSKVSFLMNAPIEKINGEVVDATKGDVYVDVKDVTKTAALIQVDLDKLVLFQQKRDDEKGEFGEKVKNDQQNTHARNWLEIASDAPADVREKNRWVEFKIDKLVDPSASDLTKMTGAERKITATAVGDFPPARTQGREARQDRGDVPVRRRQAEVRQRQDDGAVEHRPGGVRGKAS